MSAWAHFVNEPALHAETLPPREPVGVLEQLPCIRASASSDRRGHMMEPLGEVPDPAPRDRPSTRRSSSCRRGAGSDFGHPSRLGLRRRRGSGRNCGAEGAHPIHLRDGKRPLHRRWRRHLARGPRCAAPPPATRERPRRSGCLGRTQGGEKLGYVLRTHGQAIANLTDAGVATEARAGRIAGSRARAEIAIDIGLALPVWQTASPEPGRIGGTPFAARSAGPGGCPRPLTDNSDTTRP